MTAIFNGLETGLSNLFRLSSAKSRSVSPENITGGKGAGGMATEGTGAAKARDLGRGWKIAPSIFIQPGETATLADISGSGVIQQIWFTHAFVRWRSLILRVYWDDQSTPSIEVPIGDFFCMGWNKFAPLASLPVCVNPGQAFNCYWQMPFRSRARVTLENRDREQAAEVLYQINFCETEVPTDAAYFHAQFRRSNPVPLKCDHTILDAVKGTGHYVGTYMAWGVNSSGWWGEGEVKFFLDGDADFPTICTTGTEDYFCGSHNFDLGTADGSLPKAFSEFTSPHSGLVQVLRPDGAYESQTRFGMYRWHLHDPIRFERDLRVTVQDIGWRPTKEKLYRPQQDDISSTAFWYQTLPTAPFPPLPEEQELEVQ